MHAICLTPVFLPMKMYLCGCDEYGRYNGAAIEKRELYEPNCLRCFCRLFSISETLRHVCRSQHLEKLEVEHIEDPDELRLKKNVLLAFTDTCAGGR